MYAGSLLKQAAVMLGLVAVMHSALVFAADSSNALTDVPVACNPTDTALVGKQFKLVQQSGARKTGGGGSVTVGGTLTIVDGCTFTVDNFVFSPPAGQPYWYGISAKDNTNLWKANGGVIGVGAGTSFTWTLYGVSWAQLDGIGIYSEQYKTFIGIACFSGACNWNGDDSDDSSSSATSTILHASGSMSAMITKALIAASVVAIAIYAAI